MDFKELLDKIQIGIRAYLKANYGKDSCGSDVYLDLKTNRVFFSYYWAGDSVGMINGSASVALEDLLNPEKFQEKIAAEKEERELLKKLQEKYGPANGHTLFNGWTGTIPTPSTLYC